MSRDALVKRLYRPEFETSASFLFKMHPNKKNFIDGLELILNKWTALRLAIEMEWGGPYTAQKAQDLHYSLVDYFENGNSAFNVQTVYSTY